jgi:putative addiction module component (TIGR02574 family)
MPVNAKSLGLEDLDINEKVALVEELWIDVVASEQAHPISPELANKLDRRIAAFEANPDDVLSLQQVMETLRKDRCK